MVPDNKALNRLFRGDFNIVDFYSKDNPASFWFQTKWLLQDKLLETDSRKAAMGDLNRFHDYIDTVNSFIRHLTDSEKKYAEIVDEKRFRELSELSGIESKVIKFHIEFYLQFSDFISKSLEREGRVRGLVDFNNRFDRFVRERHDRP